MFAFDPFAGAAFASSSDVAPGEDLDIFKQLAESADARARFLVEVHLVPAHGVSVPLVEAPFCSLPFATLEDEENIHPLGTSLLLSDGFWASKPSDAYRPNTSAIPVLMSAADIERTLPLQPGNSRRAQQVVGQIEIANGSGLFDDYVANWAPDGQVVESWLGPARGPFKDFEKIWSSFGDSWSSDGKSVRLTLKDTQFFLDVPLLRRKYGGTGAADGDADLEGQLVPQTWGEVFNIAPKLVNKDLQIWQIHDGPIFTFDAVKEDGLPFQWSGHDYESFNFLRGADDPEPGQYHTCLAAGCFRLATEPVGTITCDARGDNAGGVYADTTGDILLRMAETRALINRSLIYSPSFKSLPTGKIGVYLSGGEDVLISTAFDLLLQPINGWYGVLRDRQLRVGRISLPEFVGAERSFGYSDLITIERLPTPVAPRWRQAVAWGRNWTPLSTDDLSEGVLTPEQISRLSLEYQGAVVEQASEVRTRHRSAIDGGTMLSYFRDEVDAREAASYLMKLFREDRELFVGTVKRVGYLVNINDVVELYPRFNLEDGKRGTVVGTREIADKAEVELTIWGSVSSDDIIIPPEEGNVISVNGMDDAGLIVEAEDIPYSEVAAGLGPETQAAMDQLAQFLISHPPPVPEIPMSRRGGFGYVSGRYYGPEHTGTGNNVLMIANQLYFALCYFEKGYTFDRIAYEVQAISGGAGNMQVRCGIYRHQPGIVGSPRLVDAGVVAGNNVVGAKTAVINWVCPADGWYYIALIANANGDSGALPTLRAKAVAVTDLLAGIYGFTTPTQTSADMYIGYYADEAVASWAAYTLPATIPVVTGIGTGTGCPMAWLRAA